MPDEEELIGLPEIIITDNKPVESFIMNVYHEHNKGHKEVALLFTDKNKGVALQVLKALDEAFGWHPREENFGRTTRKNTRCFFRDRERKCTNEKTGWKGICSEHIRSNCDHWKEKYPNPMVVNFAIIEQDMRIRD